MTDADFSPGRREIELVIQAKTDVVVEARELGGGG
jgi:hypothetical protein